MQKMERIGGESRESRKQKESAQIAENSETNRICIERREPTKQRESG